ncbi:MAG: LytTR family transcriptional regulator [Clostridia bacterium]|nr:LytTR family transcriptional regulator [Clostridia bacterium]
MKCTIVMDKSREEEVVIYLQKPSDLPARIEALLEEGRRELIGYGDKTIVKLDVREVVCFTVEDGRVYAVTAEEKLQLRRRLYELEEMLDADFLKINQSCIANVRKIQRFDVSLGGSLLVIFQNGYRDYVSRRRLKTVKERIGFRL